MEELFARLNKLNSKERAELICKMFNFDFRSSTTEQFIQLCKKLGFNLGVNITIRNYDMAKGQFYQVLWFEKTVTIVYNSLYPDDWVKFFIARGLNHILDGEFIIWASQSGISGNYKNLNSLKDSLDFAYNLLQ